MRARLSGVREVAAISAATGSIVRRKVNKSSTKCPSGSEPRRQAIEPMAAEIAATARTPDSLARIADAFGRMERFRNGDGDLIGADVDFHVASLAATGNHFLAALGGLIQAALECSFRFTWIGAASIRDDRLEQHRGILAAISEGAPGPARARMIELLNDSLDDMRKFRESRSRDEFRVGAKTGDLNLNRAPQTGRGGPSPPDTEDRRCSR